MSNIMVNIDKLKEFRNLFNNTGSDLLFEVKKINNEIMELDKILDTPKGKKYEEMFMEYMYDEIKIIEKFNDKIDKNIGVSIKSYEEFLADGASMVMSNE